MVHISNVIIMKNKSYWQNELKSLEAKKEHPNKTDVLIIGGGMAGLITAYELSNQSNLNITIVTKEQFANDVSAKTNAKITPFHNLMYQNILKCHGLMKARQYYESQVEAMNYLLEIIKKEKIDCNLVKEKNYVYANTEDGIGSLEKEILALQKIDIPFESVSKMPIKLPFQKAICFTENYLFHPIKYLNSIIEILKKRKSVILLENYNALKYDKKDNHYVIHFEHQKPIEAEWVVVATHYPIFNFAGLYFAKLYQEKSYLLSFQTEKKIQGMYINADKTVFSVRYDQNTIIMLGNSHICGKEAKDENPLKSLEKKAFDFDKNARISYEWTNQDVLSIDYLPFIGEYSRFTPNMYVATAFETWGMTNSHVSALLLTKTILNKKSSYQELYSPLRFSHVKSIFESAKMMGRAANGLVLSKLMVETVSLGDLEKDCGNIVTYQDKRYGGFYDGEYYYLVKPTCTHTKCFLAWNQEEKTWDCKCHGSRFDVYGKSIQGPAIQNLDFKKIKKDAI